MLSHLSQAQVQALPANQAHVQYEKQSLHTQLSACIPISITRFPLSFWQHPPSPALSTLIVYQNDRLSNA